MARPRQEQPTPAELELLKVLWEFDRAASVREVLEAANQGSDPPRAYTTVMSLLNVMTDKGLLRRSPSGRAFVYEPIEPRERTLGALLQETLKRVFDGSASLMVAHLLDQSSPSSDELEAIRSLIDAHQAQNPDGPPSPGDSRCHPSRRKPLAD